MDAAGTRQCVAGPAVPSTRRATPERTPRRTRGARLALVVGAGLLALGCPREEPTPPPPEVSVSLPPAKKTLGPSLLTERPLKEGIARLGAHLGGAVQVLELRVFPNRLVLQAQDPKRPQNVDQYVYLGGKVSAPVPVKLQGKGQLNDNLFPLADLKLTTIPPLAGKALEELRLQGAKVTYVSIKRNLPETMDVRLRVYVKSPRKDAHRDYDVDGNSLHPRDK